jgi:hypothetical protein
VPRIPDVTNLGERRAPVGRAPEYQDRSSEIVAGSIGNAARQLGGAVSDFADRRDNFRVAKAGAAFSTAEATARQFQDNDWETYEPRYREAMTKAKEAALKDVRLPVNRQALELEFDTAVERGVLNVRNTARGKEVEFGRADLSSMLDSYRTSALSSSDESLRQKNVVGAQTAIKAALDNQYIDPTDAERVSKSWTQSYGEGILDTLPFSQQVDMLKKPEGTPAGFLAPDRRSNLLRQAENSLRAERDRAEAERRTQLIEVRQSLTDQLRDITVGAQMGLPVSVPSKAVLQSAFGEREGAQRYELASKAASLSGDIAAMQQLPTSEIVSRVDSYKPTKTEGAADQAQLYGVVSKSAGDIIKQRMDDPAGYLTQFAPRSQAAWQAFQQDGSPQTRDAYLFAVDADRERLQLPKGDVLPNSYAKALADEISNPKSAEKLASLMEAEAQRWGDRWPDVHAQIAKGIPDMAAVIGSGIDRSAAVTLASTAKLKDTELQAMLPASVKWGDVQADVASKFNDVRRSFPAEGARTYQAIADSATRLAVSYMQAGDSKDNAIARAYQELIGKQYAIGEVKNVSFLVPQQFDAGLVEESAERFIAGFTPSTDMIAVPAGEDPARFIPRATQAMRENAYWVSRGDGQGLRLYLGARPTAVTRSFQELQDAETERRVKEQADVVRQRENAMRARGGGK